MTRLFILLLTWRAKVLVRRFSPKVIAITGSVGKTSARQAISLVVSDHFDARTATKNYNNEFGVPLAILGEESPGASLLGWMGVFWRTVGVKQFPELLVLEYGIDRPGDMDHLLRVARPHVGVFTAVSEVHAEYFPKGILGIQEEKGKLIEGVLDGGTAVLCLDDELVMKTAVPSGAELVTYGTKRSDVQAKNIQIIEHGGAFQQSAHVVVDGRVVGQLLMQRLGDGAVYSALSAIAVGTALGIEPMTAIKTLNRTFVAEPGRLQLLRGKQEMILVDDTYNAAPASMKNGLELVRDLSKIGKGRRVVAVLGQMAELGVYSEARHQEIGELAGSVADVVVGIGPKMKQGCEAARQKKGVQVEWFADSKEAALAIESIVKPGDLVFAKGSQSQRTERVLKVLLHEDIDPHEVLVRQTAAWLKT